VTVATGPTSSLPPFSHEQTCNKLGRREGGKKLFIIQCKKGKVEQIAVYEGGGRQT